MSTIIAGSIDLNKIDKSRIVTGKNGAKYYNISIIINDTKDQYGNDCSIQEGQTKEERSAKKERKYIGNGKTIYSGQPKQQAQNENSQTFTDGGGDSLPF